MKQMWIIVSILILVSLIPMSVSVDGGKTSEPIYGHQYTLNGGAQYDIPFYRGSNISINITGWTGTGAMTYGVSWSNVLYTKSFDDATTLAGSVYWKNDSNIWFISAIDQMLSLQINAPSASLKYTINMTNITTPQAQDLAPIYDLINNLNATINALNTTIQNLQSDTTAISSQIDDILSQINTLMARVNNNTINITALQTAIASLQGQFDNLKNEVASINATVITNITQTANLTAINASLVTLSKALDDLNVTVKNLNIPPDTQADVTKLQAENAQLRKDLDALKNTPPKSNVTLYSNNTINNTKKVVDAGAIGAVEVVGSGAIGASVAAVVVAVALSGRKKRETVEEETVEEPEPMPEAPPTPEPVPVAKATATPEEPPKPIEKAKVIAIGMAEYTESDLMAKLTSLPRGLPPELSDKDISTLAYELMGAEYAENEDGDVLVHLGKKWFHGNPEHTSTYMQKAKPPTVKKPLLKSPSADSELDDILRKI